MKTNLFSRTNKGFHLCIFPHHIRIGTVLIFLLAFVQINSQIYVIDPAVNGGFESGNSFAANGWNTAQTGNGREWFVGTAAGSVSPTRAAYVGNNGTNNGISAAKTVHFFRDVAIPAGATNVNLSFYLKQTVTDNNDDFLRVFTTTTANTPQSGIMPTTGYTQRYQNTATQYNNFTQIPVINLTALAGTTVRLVFTFRSDGGFPHANPAVDNISLSYTLPANCPTPLSPTNLQLVVTGTTIVNGSFTAPATMPSGFMIIRSTTATAPTVLNGTTYNTGANFGVYYVVRGSNTNDVSTSFTDTGLAPNTTYYYWVYSFNNACTGTKPVYSSVLSGNVRTTSVPYCIPTVGNNQASRVYINKVQFIGTLNDYINSSTFTPNIPAGSRGYQDFTATGPVRQIQGESINILVTNTGSNTNNNNNRSVYKAWIDLNNNGVFTDTVNLIPEEIYNSNGVGQTSATFGFLIPENLPPGIYRLRIRISRASSTFGSCGNTTDGETEDYTIEVIEKCVSRITGVVNGVKCGTGNVTMSVTTENADSVRWYTTATGGAPVATTPVNANSSVYSPNLSASTIYYVAPYNTAKNCEYQIRKEVKAIVKVLPSITFNVANPEICEINTPLEVSATGGEQIEYLVDENFESESLGVFSSVKLAGDTSDNTNANWNNYKSAYKPVFGSWNPIISSGFSGNHFVMTVSDLGDATYKRALELTNPLNTNGFSDLTIKYRVYFSKYGDGTNYGVEYVVLQALYNGTWEDLQILDADTGFGNSFATVAPVALPAKYLNRTDVKIRIVYNAAYNDGVAIDDVQMYGTKAMPNANFAFYGANVGIYTDAAGTINYNLGDFVQKVYVKPNTTELETTESWTITAAATLLNGCSAEGEISIQNNAKIWNNAVAINDWNTTNWKPNNTVPTNDKCVIIKTPVNVLAGADGLAKSVRVESGGKLTIQNNSSLTVTDAIVNQAAATDVVVESDGNLIQINGAAVNTGNATVKRNSSMKRLDYTYWGTPVEGQTLKTFSPNTVTNRFYSYNEEDDSFSIITPLTNPMVKGQGYVIRAPNNFTTALQTWPATFSGKPHNGTVDVAVTKLGGGKNLVGNPYPSNIDLVQLTSDNSTVLTGTYYFWTNNATWTSNTGGIGTIGNYNGNGYAAWNGSGGVQATNSAGASVGQIPTRYVKPGQGFLAEASQAGTVSFKNGIRTKDGGASPFFNRGTAEQNSVEAVSRFWLTLTTPVQTVSTVLVAYVQGATNVYDPGFDAVFPSEVSDRFFTLSNDREFLIQGRQFPLAVTDVVSLGMSHYADGNYTIALAEREGVFATGQNVYLRDKATGTVTNLSEGSYTYSAVHGISSDRFEIIYEPQTVLAADGTLNENIQVYRDGSDFVIKSPGKKITGIEVYDTSGKLMVRSGANQTEVRMDGTNWVNGVYVLKIDRTGEITTRKIRK